MPRSRRNLEEFGFTHIITRGNGKQVVFEDSSDYRFYLSRLEKYSAETGVTVCAYCLMENHMHLLVLGASAAIPQLMRKLGTSYAMYFNRKYERTGSVFEGRYKNVIIPNARALLSVFRYILQNPAKAGICPAHHYPWSSYSLYGQEDTFVDSTHLFELIGDKKNLQELLRIPEDLPYHEFSNRSDDYAKTIISKLLKTKNTLILQQMTKAARDVALRLLKKAGLHYKTIQRYTGIGLSTIRRA